MTRRQARPVGRGSQAGTRPAGRSRPSAGAGTVGHRQAIGLRLRRPGGDFDRDRERPEGYRDDRRGGLPIRPGSRTASPTTSFRVT